MYIMHITNIKLIEKKTVTSVSSYIVAIII